MNGETTRAYGERLADQMAYLNRLVQETSGHQRGIGCYVARHNRRHPDRPVSHNNSNYRAQHLCAVGGGLRRQTRRAGP